MVINIEKSKVELKKFYENNAFLIQILLGVILGAVIGAITRSLVQPTSEIAYLIGYPGELFLRALKLIVLPFIVCCVIIGTATLDISKSKLIALRVIAYFFLCSLFNVVLGLTLSLVFNPGHVRVDDPRDALKADKLTLLDTLLDVGRNLVADNLFETTFTQTYTLYSMKNISRDGRTELIQTKSIKLRPGTNTLGLTFFCIVFGCVLGTLQAQKDNLVKFFSYIHDVLQKMLLIVIWLTPYCVASIICNKIITVPNILSTLQQLGYFIVISICGMLFYQLVVAQFIYFLVLKKNPFKYYLNIMPAILTGFATASKSASLPVMFQVMEKLKMNSKITQFVLPIGTINLNGSAQYMGSALVFLAQLEGVALTLNDLITLVFACTFASMSSAAVPSAAIVMVNTLCSVISLPTSNVGLLLSVDWLIDRFRTSTNVLGDCYTIAVVQHLSQEELREQTPDHGQLTGHSNEIEGIQEDA